MDKFENNEQLHEKFDDRSMILVANHASYIDIMLMFRMRKKPFVFVINTGVLQLKDCKATLCPDGWYEFFKGIIVNLDFE